MREVIEQWSRKLARFVSCALDEFRPRAAERMEGFAVDLYPWNAVVILAFLTAKEFEEEPFLADAREMAAWRFYDFASDLSCSHPGPGSRTCTRQNAARRPRLRRRFSWRVRRPWRASRFGTRWRSMTWRRLQGDDSTSRQREKSIIGRLERRVVQQ